jgi:preprotein translocase subunit YajC
MAAGSIMFIGNVIDHTMIRTPKGPAGAIIVGNGLYLLIQMLMLYYLIYRPHQAEVELQRKGKYDKLNLLTISFISGGPVLKTIIAIVWMIGVWMFGITDISVVTYGLSGFLWYYAGTIMVRERDADRFKQDSYAAQGT